MAYKLRLIVIFLYFNWISQSQITKSSSTDQLNFNRAVALFDIGQYKPAQVLFSNLVTNSNSPQITCNASYFTAVCAIRLNLPSAQSRLESFLDNYPTSPRRNLIFLEAGNYYFNKTKFAYAKKWYQNVEPDNLKTHQKELFFFRHGYSNFRTDNFEQAKTCFKNVEFSDQYGSQARYYLGFMAYQQDDYDSASLLFQSNDVEQQFGEELAYFKADLKFKLGAFQEAIDASLKALDDASPNEVSELNKIIGESFFNLKNYDKAIPYLKQYKGKNGKWTHVDFYQLGYAYYRQNLFEDAIGEFNKIIGGTNALAQNAYYHLAECYIKNNQKEEALNAFKSASELTYNLKIQEDAWLNYAKLSYDIGNPYTSVSQVLTDFLKQYPKSPFAHTIESLLIDSYVSSQNYKEALMLLEDNMRNALKPVYQKVAFYRALELYNQNELLAAKSLFEKVISSGIDPELSARAYFWKAEIDFYQLNFQSALDGYLEFKSKINPNSNLLENNHLEYNLGYSYFKLKLYGKAILAFQNYVTKPNRDELLLFDTYLRKADAYFVSKNYTKAIEWYKKLIQNEDPFSDYATFQMAICYGFLGETKTKISTLKSVLTYKNSKYLDDINFELANTYNTLNKSKSAVEFYDTVIVNFPKSKLVSTSLLRKGLLLYNQSDNLEALAVLKQVAEQYPATPEAYQAISSVRLLYIDDGKVNDYAKWVGTLPYVSKTEIKLESAAYEAAEKQYLESNTERAINLFNSYIENYTQGSRQIQAHFYLADLYYSQDLKINALPHYEFVINQSNNEFTEPALQKVCVIALEQNMEVTSLLKRLERESKNPQNTLFAQSNLMKVFFKEESYNMAIEYSDNVLNDTRTNRLIKNDALAIKARSALAQQKDSLAKTSFETILRLSSSNYGAEATYYLAYFKHKDSDFENSNLLIQELIKTYPNNKSFAAKGLILMAQNFYALEDTFQATYILESVIDNFESFADITEEAKALLNQYKETIGQTNSSLESTNNTPNTLKEQQLDDK